jgi:release factor glutamine methyltransferase
MTVGDALRLAVRRLADAGVPEPPLDAELLLRHVLRWDRATLLAAEATGLAADQEARFFSLVEEREGRRPLQHLTGTQAFYGREFVVTPDVLIPRPETEVLVEAALALLPAAGSAVVVDIGTGSGCIALTLAGERPAAELHALDISPEALEVARDNARRLGLESRVRFYQGDLALPLRDMVRLVDLVVSNPPYVAEAEWAGLQPEVRDHEPRLALVPVPDAPRMYRRLAGGARRLLRPGGTLVLEVGHGLAEEVSAVCEREGYRVDRVVPDLQGIPRVVVARRPPGPNAPPPRVD